MLLLLVLLLLAGEEEDDDEDELPATGAEDADEEPAAATGGAPHGTSQGSAANDTRCKLISLRNVVKNLFDFSRFGLTMV